MGGRNERGANGFIQIHETMKHKQQSIAALANLRALVELHKVTHQALANRIQNEKTGQPIRKQSVTGMLNRRFSPTLDTVFQMLNALNEVAGTQYTLKDI